jgi:hypothetical protein
MIAYPFQRQAVIDLLQFRFGHVPFSATTAAIPAPKACMAKPLPAA